MRYARSFLITLSAKFLAIPIGVLSTIITARVLGPEGRGIIAILAVIQGLAIQFGTLGFNASITYFLSKDPALRTQINSNSFIVATWAGIFIAGSFFVLQEIFPSFLLGRIQPLYLFIFLPALPFTLYIQFFQNVLLARQRIWEFNILDLVNRALQLGGLFILLILLKKSTFEAVLWITLSTALSGILTLFRAHGDGPVQIRFHKELFRKMMSYGFRTYIASFFMFLVVRINLLMVNSMMGEESAGVFSIALQFADLIYLLPLTLGMILFPTVSSAEGDRGELTTKVFRFSLIAVSSLCFFLWLGGRWIILLMFGDPYESAAEPLYWLLPGVLSLSLVTILNNDLAARGLPRVVIVAPSIALFINVVLNFFLIPAMGIAGASLASSIVSALMLFVLSFYFMHLLRVPWSSLFIPKIRDLFPRDAIARF